MPIWRSPISNSLAVASRNTLPSSSTASNSFTLPAGERSPAVRFAPLVQWSSANCEPVWQAAAAPLVVQAILAVEGSSLMAMTLREPLRFVAAHGVRAHLRRALRGDDLVELRHGIRAHDPVDDEPVGALERHHRLERLRPEDAVGQARAVLCRDRHRKAEVDQRELQHAHAVPMGAPPQRRTVRGGAHDVGLAGKAGALEGHGASSVGARTLAPQMSTDDGTSLDFATTTFFTATAAGGGVSLLNAAIPEIGHSLGLKHADTLNLIMFAPAPLKVAVGTGASGCGAAYFANAMPSSGSVLSIRLTASFCTVPGLPGRVTNLKRITSALSPTSAMPSILSGSSSACLSSGTSMMSSLTFAVAWRSLSRSVSRAKRRLNSRSEEH